MRCVICGDPDPDIDDGRCMDCISAGIAQREAYAEQDNAIREARPTTAPPVAEKTELDQAGRGEPRTFGEWCKKMERIAKRQRGSFKSLDTWESYLVGIEEGMAGHGGAALGSRQELREALRLRATELHVDQNGSGLPLRGYDQCHKHGFETCKSPKCVDARAALALPLAPKVPHIDPRDGQHDS